MSGDEGCRFPENKPYTSYAKGCRCERCREGKRVARSRERPASESSRRRQAVYHREWVAANPGAVERMRRSRADRYAKVPATIRGRWSRSEDAVAIGWEGRAIDLAIALGRSYWSTKKRLGILRKRGLR